MCFLTAESKLRYNTDDRARARDTLLKLRAKARLHALCTQSTRRVCFTCTRPRACSHGVNLAHFVNKRPILHGGR